MLIDKLKEEIINKNIKYIFCDMDGCLAVFSHNGKVNIDKWYQSGIFSTRRPMQSVIDKLKVFQEECGCKVFILSASPNNIANAEKYEWLRKYIDFVDICNNVILLGNPNYKINTMNEVIEKEYRQLTPQAINDLNKQMDTLFEIDDYTMEYSTIEELLKNKSLIIDDTHSILFDAESHGYNAWHISYMVD